MVKSAREKFSLNEEVKVFRAKGCNSCQNTGYKGRVALCEYLSGSPKIKQHIDSHASESVIKKEASLEGMRTLREDGITKVEKGITTVEEVLKVTSPDEPLG